jgi:hypothetical protein
MALRTKVYDHIQSTPSTTWTVTHNLGVKPINDVWVTVNGVNSKAIPLQVLPVNDNVLTITFATPQVGGVRCAGGEFEIVLHPNVIPHSP